MKACMKLLCLIVALCFVVVPQASARSESSDGEPVIVGRISYVEGQLLRYVYDEKDWVATIKDSPFGLNDSLYSDDQGRAEFIIPNNTWIRIGGTTQIQAIAVERDVTEVDVASGVARFYNKSGDTVIKATTPFGFVVAPAGTIFDLYVGDQSAEVITIKGSVDFVNNDTRYEAMAGSSSILADSRMVSSGSGTVDEDWDDWNRDRDSLWAKNLEVRGESVRYLPSELEDESHVLEENGRWERVYYNNEYHNMWRPRVSADWRPYTAGRWTDYYGDNCWVPDEPFGYVTHHYGSWVYVDTSDSWYWAPPVVRPVVSVGVAPAVSIGFGWYPGRVSWIHSGVNVGWVPLAPYEPYYAHRHWGPATHIYSSGTNINININNFAYARRAVIINRDHFYNVNNYRNVQVTNINNTTIINNFRAAPVVNDTVIHNYRQDRRRFNFTDVNVERKPIREVVNRIEHNRSFAQRDRAINAAMIERDIKQSKRRAEPVRDANIAAPRLTNKIVPISQVNQERAPSQLPVRELKRKAKAPERSPIEQVIGREGAKARPAKAGAMDDTPDRIGQPGERMEGRDQPGRPGRPGKPDKFDQQDRPGLQDQPGRPGDVDAKGRRKGMQLEKEGPAQPVGSDVERSGRPVPPDQKGVVSPRQGFERTREGAEPRRPGMPDQPGRRIAPDERGPQPKAGDEGQVESPRKMEMRGRPGASEGGAITPPQRPGMDSPRDPQEKVRRKPGMEQPGRGGENQPEERSAPPDQRLMRQDRQGTESPRVRQRDELPTRSVQPDNVRPGRLQQREAPVKPAMEMPSGGSERVAPQRPDSQPQRLDQPQRKGKGKQQQEDETPGQPQRGPGQQFRDQSRNMNQPMFDQRRVREQEEPRRMQQVNQERRIEQQMNQRERAREMQRDQQVERQRQQAVRMQQDMPRQNLQREQMQQRRENVQQQERRGGGGGGKKNKQQEEEGQGRPGFAGR